MMGKVARTKAAVRQSSRAKVASRKARDWRISASRRPLRARSRHATTRASNSEGVMAYRAPRSPSGYGGGAGGTSGWGSKPTIARSNRDHDDSRRDATSRSTHRTVDTAGLGGKTRTPNARGGGGTTRTTRRRPRGTWRARRAVPHDARDAAYGAGVRSPRRRPRRASQVCERFLDFWSAGGRSANCSIALIGHAARGHVERVSWHFPAKGSVKHTKTR